MNQSLKNNSFLVHQKQMKAPKHMQDQIETHSAWLANANFRHIQTLLSEKSPFTYCFRQGELPNQYILSFMDQNHLIQHHRIHIKFSKRIGWYFQNVAAEVRSNIIELIPFIMKCMPDQCISLK